MRKRFRPARLAGVLLIAMAALAGAICLIAAEFSTTDCADAEKFLARNESAMAEILEAARDRFIRADNADAPLKKLFSGGLLQYIDGRGADGATAFGFKRLHPETSATLYHCPDGTLPDVLGWTNVGAGTLTPADVPPDGLRLEGLGMGGRGYVLCVPLRPQWYFVEAYLPT